MRSNDWYELKYQYENLLRADKIDEAMKIYKELEDLIYDHT